MNESEPPSSGGASEHEPAFSRLRDLLRRIRHRRNGVSERQTIDQMIEGPVGDGAAPLAPHERVLIGNILKVHGRNAADVMVPRGDIVALDAETPFADVVKSMVEQGHSRVPVYR